MRTRILILFLLGGLLFSTMPSFGQVTSTNLFFIHKGKGLPRPRTMEASVNGTISYAEQTLTLQFNYTYGDVCVEIENNEGIIETRTFNIMHSGDVVFDIQDFTEGTYTINCYMPNGCLSSANFTL